MEKVFINGEDLKQFLLYYHGYVYDEKWVGVFKTQHPNFSRENFVDFQVTEKFNGKTMLRFRKGSSEYSKKGIVIHPIFNAGDSILELPLPRLYFPFGTLSEYWGNNESINYPEMVYPCLRIVGVEI